MSDFTDHQWEAQRAEVHAAIANAAAVCAPDDMENPLLVEWTIVANWMDPVTGDVECVSVGSEGLLHTHRLGLLQAAIGSLGF